MATFRLDITAEGNDVLADAMRTAFKAAKCFGKTPRGDLIGVTHYAIREAEEGARSEGGGWQYGREPKPLRLIFFNHFDRKPAGDDKIVCPFKLDAEVAADFARRWLEEAEYGPERDTDGHCQKGWRLFNQQYEASGIDWRTVIAISPAWIVYGK